MITLRRSAVAQFASQVSRRRRARRLQCRRSAGWRNLHRRFHGAAAPAGCNAAAPAGCNAAGPRVAQFASQISRRRYVRRPGVPYRRPYRRVYSHGGWD
jgi:hypothetical protein